MGSRFTYANVASTLALFAVIAGGTAVALPGKRTVQANDLKKNSVKAVAIAKNAVRTADIQADAVTGAKLKDGEITSADVADLGLAYPDLGSNSVVARIRSKGAVQTGDGDEASPVTIPISGNTWTQAANETDVFFAEVTYTQPPVCTSGSLQLELLIDGQLVDRDGASADPNQTVTEPTLAVRPFVFEPGAAKARTAELRAFDSCDNAGEQFTVTDVKVNAVAMR